MASNWLPCMTIVVLGLLVWGHTVRYEFVWDDRQFIQDLPSIRSLNNIPQMFHCLEAQSSYPEGFKLFRPLRTLHYALLYWLGGKEEPQPWLFHLANVLWHACVCVLLLFVGQRLFRLTLPKAAPARVHWLAFWVAAAFTIHPVVSEVVCWAKSLDDAMATLFTLAALYTLLPRKSSAAESEMAPGSKVGKRYWLALFWFALAVYSKISAVPFALAVLPVFFLVLKLPWRRAGLLTSGFLAIGLAFMVHRHFVIGQSSQTAPLSGTYLQTLLDMFPVVPKYFRLLCGVPPFCIDYSWMRGHEALFSAGVLGGGVMALASVLFGAYALRKPGLLLPALGVLWMGFFLLPVSNLLPMMQYMAERFLYLPLIGWLWVMAYLLSRLSRRRANIAIAGLVLVCWGSLAYNRSLLWQDKVTLFVQSSRERPSCKRLEDNAIAAIFQLPHLKSMFKLEPVTAGFVVAALPEARQGDLPPEARQAIGATLLTAQELFPANDTVASALAIFYINSREYPKALAMFQATAGQHPENPRNWVNLGRVYLDVQEEKLSEEAAQKALRLSPDNPDALQLVAELSWRQQNYRRALETLRHLKTLQPASTKHDRWIAEAEEKVKASPSAGAAQ